MKSSNSGAQYLRKFSNFGARIFAKSSFQPIFSSDPETRAGPIWAKSLVDPLPYSFFVNCVTTLQMFLTGASLVLKQTIHTNDSQIKLVSIGQYSYY